MGIYPVIQLPTLTTPKRSTRHEPDKIAPLFDFLSGDFIFAGGRPVFADPQEAFEQWAVKVCLTERNTRLAYSDKIGVELRSLPQITDPDAAKSRLIRTISEAILIHPRATFVKNFSFKISGDNVRVSFDVGANRLEVEL